MKNLQFDSFLPFLLVLHLLKIHIFVAYQFCLALEATTYIQLVSCILETPVNLSSIELGWLSLAQRLSLAQLNPSLSSIFTSNWNIR